MNKVKTLEIKDNSVDEITDGLVVMKFWAPWCSSCITYTPVLENVLRETNKDLKLANCNVDENSELKTAAEIKLLPSIIVFKDGEEIERFVGSQTPQKLKEYFDSI